MMGCGPGNICCGHCQSGGGLGEAPIDLMNRYPRTTQVLLDYISQQVAAGQPWHLSPDVNSDVYPMGQMGFLAAIVAAVTGIAAAIGHAAPTIAAVAGMTSGGGGGGSNSPTAADIAAAVTPAVAAQLKAQGISLPNSVAGAAVQASLLDSFGPANRPWVIAGIAGVGLLVLLKLIRR